MSSPIQRAGRLPSGARHRQLLAALLLAALSPPGPAAGAVPGPRAAGAQVPAAGRGVQGPRADWRTAETEHFRVHYPAVTEAWARQAASRLETVRARVGEAVGYTPEEVVDVVVSDPLAEPNGFAYPILGWPRLVLWTSPPGPQSVIGHYRDWPETLLVHEETHLAHLLRPSRNPWRRLLARLLPLGPISGAPRWVAEGYATVIEGRLTGSGRPFGDLRAAVLRRWAMAGRLPSYGALAADDSTYLGTSMAYLAGSAYLEWLEERAGPGSLRDLWARMTARHRRDFDDAFRGVFGDGPAELYGRFTAELSWRALEADRRLDEEEGGSGFREGEPWMELEWGTGAPAVSPDGERLAVVLESRDDPAELAVFATAVDEEAVEETARRRAAIAERDPADVPAIDVAPPPHERLATLPAIDGAEPAEPRWMPDGESLLVVRFLADQEGFLHPDLHRWWPASGRLDRLTRGADLRHPDPSPDGAWAAAVRDRHGASQLVRVELPAPGAAAHAADAVSALTEASVETVYDAPRISPDGAALAYLRHRSPLASSADAGGWELVLRRLADGGERTLPVPAGADVAAPAWGRGASSGTLYAAVGLGGFIDLYAFQPDTAGGAWRAERLTLSRGAALAPAVAGDGGALYFLALEPAGLELRRLDLAAGSAAAPAGDGAPRSPFQVPADLADLAPTVPPAAPPAPPPPVAAELPPSRPYGLGRQELLPLAGGTASTAGDAFELGLRSGDLLGRLDLLAAGAVAGGGLPEGGVLAAAWRGPTPVVPLAFAAHAFAVSERPSAQRLDATARTPGSSGLFDLDRRGLELSAAWERLLARGPLRLAGGLYAGSVEGRRMSRLDERISFAETSWAPEWSRGDWQWRLGAAGRWDSGRSDRVGWERWRGRLGGELAHADTRLALGWAGGETDPYTPQWQRFQLGGAESTLLPSSVLAARELTPALPAATLLGDRFEARRATLDTSWLPLPLFYTRYRFDNAGVRGEWLEVYGGELHLRFEPVPLLRLPAAEARLGVARIEGPPFDGETSWWLTLAWRP